MTQFTRSFSTTHAH